MGLADTSPTPKKDPMGMDYIPVYEGDDGAAATAVNRNQIRIGTEKVQKLGVRTEAASRRRMDHVIRAAGRIVADERRVYAISPKFEGYVERLHVNVTGQPVAKGQPLFEVYSPDMMAAQGEYAVAVRGLKALNDGSEQARRRMQDVVDASLLRLRNWDVPEDEIQALVETGQARRTLTYRSPVTGIVTDKKALQGMRFVPGEALYQVTDLASVWVIAEVFEQDIESVRIGAQAQVRLAAYPDRTFRGTTTYVYPTLTSETRTVAVRIELSNPGRLLKPAMFAQVELRAPAASPALVVPSSAVIDTGMRRIVLVQAGEGRFEPREVRLGQRSEDWVEVLDGVREAERVVVAANFLIDAESNLKAAIGGFAAAAGGEPGASTAGGPGPVGHAGRGTVEELDAKAGTVSIGHGPIEAVNMPAMTMQFQVANASLLEGLRVGAAVDFEFVERSPGEWVITRIERR
jgi:Cu(I)/Ag(I) efflux system membrane fusion protein